MERYLVTLEIITPKVVRDDILRQAIESFFYCHNEYFQVNGSNDNKVNVLNVIDIGEVQEILKDGFQDGESNSDGDTEGNAGFWNR